MPCLLCDHPVLEEQADFLHLMRVTSDSRIWPEGGRIAICPNCHTVQKPVDKAFMEEANRIYASYQLYFQAGGSEQKIFTGSSGKPRSELLLDYVLSLSLPERCETLDVGCGVGNLLQALSKRKPKWTLFGADISEHNREQILAIPGVKHFFSGDISAIEGTFDLIFLSHVLEHVPDPKSFLQQLSKRLKPDGVLVVLVPSYQENAFDLLVADHCLHFTSHSLQWLLESCGFSILSNGTGLCPKELWFFATPAAKIIVNNENVAINGNNVKALLHTAIGWLAHMREWAMGMKTQPKLGIFGTALAATWLTRAADLHPDFFVDEDTDRQGITYLDHPVIAPSAVPADSRVLVPLPDNIAKNVAARLNQAREEPVYLAPPAV